MDQVQHKHFRWHILLLAMISLAALLLRYWGINWPPLHPDEPTIAEWANYRQTHRHMDRRFYAEGFFTLVKPMRGLHLHLRDWRNRWDYFQQTTDKLDPPARNEILYIRKVNAWLAMLTVVALYFLVAGITGSRGAGLVGAAWLALSPLHIAHSHYAETDIATVLMLTLSLLLFIRTLNRGGGWFRFGFTSVVAGFAIGTKFTLAPLLVCALAVAWLPCGGAACRPGARHGISRTAFALLLCLAGIIIANQGILRWKWFWPNMCRALYTVYCEERRGLLTDPRNPWAVALMNLKVGAASFLDMDWLWIAMLVVGVLLSFRKSLRRLWPVTLLFPASFFVYFVFLAPWVRGQEFMLFYPSFAVWAGLCLASLDAALRRLSSKPLLRHGLPAALTLALIGGAAVAGLRRASLFAWADPRVHAAEWLHVHTPANRALGFSSYTLHHALWLKEGRALRIPQVEQTPMDNILSQGVEYVIRNPVSQGRGVCDPLTGQRYPQYEPYWNAFAARAQRLWLWDSLEKPEFRFDTAPLEYWGLIHAPPSARLDLPLFQPAYVADSSREGVWPLTAPMGSVKAVEINRFPRNLIAPGPGAPERAVYVVLQTTERDAVIRVRGMGRSRRVSLPPHAVEAVILRRPWWRPRLDAYDVLNIRTEPVKHIHRIPCYAEALMDESAVACRLLQKGYPDKALAFLKSRSTPFGWGKTLWPAFAAATAQGEWRCADPLRARAEALLADLRAAETNAPLSLTLNDISEVYYDDHSRIRLPALYMTLKNERNENDPSPPTNAVARAMLPARLAPGDYRLKFTAALSGDATNSMPVTFTVTGGAPMERTLSRVSQEVVLSLRAELESELWFAASAHEPTEIDAQHLELCWRPRDSLAMVDREICRALSRHDLARRPPDEALAAIAERADRFSDDLDLLRLRLDALSRAGRAATTSAVVVARAILAKAPAHGHSLDILATAGLTPPAAMPDGEKPTAVEFYPFFKLTGIAHLAQAGMLRCRFEVLRDGAPPTLAVLQKKTSWRGRWRKAAEREISASPMLWRGEQCFVDLPLPAEFTPPFKDLALTLKTNPPEGRSPETYAVVGQELSRVCLTRLFAGGPAE